MKLKFSVALLSSVLVAVSYAADAVEHSSAELAVTAQHGISEKVVPDSFEGAGEYRSRKAALESQLQSMAGKKLKEFTPEIFARMLEDGIQIAQLGLNIFDRLPEIAGQINQRLVKLESRVQSKNALIPWRELVALMQEIKGYPTRYWDEFKFDMDFVLRSVELQPQVVAAHGYTLSQNEHWSEVSSRGGHVALPFELMTKYEGLQYCIGESIDQLVDHKIAEESDESIARAVDFFRVKLTVGDLGIRFDISDKKFCDNNPLGAFVKWLRKKMLGESASVFEPGVFCMHDFLVKRGLLNDYTQDSSELSEWIGFNEYTSKMENTKFYEERLVNGDPIKLKLGIEMQTVYQELRTKTEAILQPALDETFAWLMTQ